MRKLKPMNHKIFIAASGTGTGFGYAQAKARWFPEISLFTGDTNPAEMVTSSLFSERHFLLSSSDSLEYFRELQDIFSEWEIDAYIPLIDCEVVQASTLKTTLSPRVICNSQKFCESATSKSSYCQWFSFEGCTALPPLAQHDLRTGAQYIAKRDGGFGGRATRIIDDIDAAERLAQDGWSLYPFINGDEYTVDCFPVDGQVVTSVRKRLEVKSGVCTKTSIIQDDVLSGVARYLCHHFSLAEPFCFQTRKNDGLHYLIDINPRLGAGTAMSALNGTDFFAAHLAQISGGSPLDFLRPRFRECLVTRQYSEYLMSAQL